MGLLDRFRGPEKNKEATDDVLLLHSILCMAGADGVIEDSEDEMIRNFANVLPEFREMDGEAWGKAMTQAKKVWIKYDRNVKSSLQALNEIKSEHWANVSYQQWVIVRSSLFCCFEAIGLPWVSDFGSEIGCS